MLVHGLPLSSTVFGPLVPELAGHRRVLAPDLPGFGRSDKPLDGASYPALVGWLRSWLDRAAPGPYALVGQGAGAAIALAASDPARVERLVLLGAALSDRTVARRVARIPGLAWAAARQVADHPEHRRALASRGTRRAIERLARGEGWPEVLARARAAARHPRPVLVAWDGGPWALARLRRELPWAVVTRGPAVPPERAPAAFLRPLLEFLV